MESTGTKGAGRFVERTKIREWGSSDEESTQTGRTAPPTGRCRSGVPSSVTILRRQRGYLRWRASVPILPYAALAPRFGVCCRLEAPPLDAACGSVGAAGQ